MSNTNIQDIIVTQKHITPHICSHLPEGYWKIIGEGLGIECSILEEINENVNNYDDYEKLCKVIHKYQQKHTHLKYCVLAPLLPEDCTRQFEEKLRTDVAEYEILEVAALSEIQHMLKIRYNNLELPDVSAWCKKELHLGDLYVDLVLHTKNNQGIDESQGPIQLEEIFKPIGKDTKATRILIEGQPGYGKTTLGYKLLFDWARGEEYMSQFQIVFNIPLRDFDGNIKATLIDNCDVDKLTEEYKELVIENYTKEILVILDGLDEIDDEKKNTLMPLLNGEEFSNMTVIVTSRTGLFYPQQEPQSKPRKKCFAKALVEKSKLKGNFYQKKIEVVGLLQHSQNLFLEKYFREERNDIERHLMNCDEVIVDLCKCPLYLFLLAILIEDEVIVDISSKTDLYENCFAYIIKRTLHKEGEIDEDDKMNLFEGTAMDLMTQFGQFALENLKKDKLCFDQEEILQHCDELILKVGFLFKHVNFNKHNRKESYQPIHKSFLEFAAAYYLWTKLKNTRDEKLRDEDTIVELVNSGFRPTEESLVYPFLAGILKENAANLFVALSPYGVFYPVNSYVFSDILTEVKMTNETFDSLFQFIPSVWENLNYPDFFTDSRHADILDRALQTESLEILGWNLYNACKFPPTVNVKTLHLLVDSDISNGLETFNKTTLTCTNLIISTNKMKPKTWKDLCTIMRDIGFQKFTVRLDLFSRKKWLWVLKTVSGIRDMRIDKLIICQLDQNTDNAMIQHIIHVVRNSGIIYGLSLRISNTNTSLDHATTDDLKVDELKGDDVDSLVQCVSDEDESLADAVPVVKGYTVDLDSFNFDSINESDVNKLINLVATSSLEEFCLVVDKNCTFKPTVNLNNFDTHPWNKLVFKGNVQVTCTFPPCSISSLVLNTYPTMYGYETLGVAQSDLSKCTENLECLQCSNAAMSMFFKNKYCHPDIRELTLDYCHKLVTGDELMCLNKLTSLKSLTLNFRNLNFTKTGGYFRSLVTHIHLKQSLEKLTIQISDKSFGLGKLFLNLLLVPFKSLRERGKDAMRSLWFSGDEPSDKPKKKPPKCLIIEFATFPPTEDAKKLTDFFEILKCFLTTYKSQTLKLHAPEDWNINGWTNWIMTTFPCSEGFVTTDEVKFYGDEIDVMNIGPSTFSRMLCIKKTETQE